MSLAIVKADLKLFFERGDRPTQAQFAAFIDAVPLVYKETVTLVADTNLQVTHGAGEISSSIQVKDSSGKVIGIGAKDDPGDPTNSIILNSAKGYTDAVVTILI